jgi:Ca2+-binding EF-hand superfamily protein
MHCLLLQEGTGKISLRMLQSFANKYGGETLSADDLRSLFQDFKPASENFITFQEFLLFFSKVSSTITNKDFEDMVDEMSS